MLSSEPARTCPIPAALAFLGWEGEASPSLPGPSSRPLLPRGGRSAQSLSLPALWSLLFSISLDARSLESNHVNRSHQHVLDLLL